MAKILIVDDSSLSRRILRNILEPAGHEVVEAVDGLTALECYALERPTLVLLDLMMAGMGGFDVLAQLGHLDSDARVIIATADIQDMTRAQALGAGALAVVTKPFQPAQVLGAVATALAARNPERSEPCS